MKTAKEAIEELRQWVKDQTGMDIAWAMGAHLQDLITVIESELNTKRDRAEIATKIYLARIASPTVTVGEWDDAKQAVTEADALLKALEARQ